MLTKIKVFMYIQWKFTKTSSFFFKRGGARPARRSCIRLWGNSWSNWVDCPLHHSVLALHVTCHIVNFEFTGLVLLQNLQYDNWQLCHIVYFIVTHICRGLQRCSMISYLKSIGFWIHGIWEGVRILPKADPVPAHPPPPPPFFFLQIFFFFYQKIIFKKNTVFLN